MDFLLHSIIGTCFFYEIFLLIIPNICSFVMLKFVDAPVIAQKMKVPAGTLIINETICRYIFEFYT